MRDAALLEIRDLSLAFAGRAVVRGVSFGIRPGETLGLVGESGSGKSLTALSILRLLPEGAVIAPGSSIRFEGQELTGLGEPAIRRLRGGRIAMVFQDPMACLNPFMAAGAQVAEAVRQHRGLSGDALRGAVAALFAEVGLEAPLAGRLPHALSGGQQQRVMIAMALAGDPVLLLADEPTTALDTTVQAQVMALLRRLAADRGLAMLFVSHDLAVVAAMADRVGVMSQGALVEIGPVATVLETPRSDEARALLAARRGQATPPLQAFRRARAPVLEVDGLAVGYPGHGLFARPVQVVRDVGFALAPGQVLGLVGGSGSGKSSVARALVGLADRTAGRVMLNGRPLPPGLAARRDPAAQRIQMVFQNPYGSLNPRRRILAALEEPLRALGLADARERRRCAAAMLAEVGLPEEHLERFPHALSGGQRQRIAIARALLAEPSVLVCDEVISALDVTVQRQVLELLRDLQARRDLALLFISHDLEAVAHIADRVMVMEGGRIIEDGATAEVLGAPRAAGTRALVDAMPGLRPVLAQDAALVQG
ncbi:ABC transporter ATP-binding protein [Roseomonas hellenica]|uniref:ABC transporter ATP-binding protein n=1 Tax=Plastoroseomonas hellenica TaxID=2687306 RepID=A0ABS5ER77_9PROT|nr:ABC transporter ATP-binding protein [Plastoroseomonas hellenica]MBR0662807.1 ABC transporter ATP-binding protein [Plastoroseomonas hellenica]